VGLTCNDKILLLIAYLKKLTLQTYDAVIVTLLYVLKTQELMSIALMV